MTRIKLCGLTRRGDIIAANQIKPEYIGFVFAEKSRRFIPPEKAAELKGLLDSTIRAVGVFVNESPEKIARIIDRDVIDLVQLHGDEDENYIYRLRCLIDKPIIQAFRVSTANDVEAAARSAADYVLLDSGAGTGTIFDWTLIRQVKRPYFLAGGLTPENAAAAVNTLRPYAVDVSSGIETAGVKDSMKMAAFVDAVRKCERNDQNHDK